MGNKLWAMGNKLWAIHYSPLTIHHSLLFIAMNQFSYIVKGILLVFLIFIGAMMVMGVANAEQEKRNSGILIDYDTQKQSKASTSISFSKGKSLFQQKCASCHSLFKDATGPALRDVIERGQWADRSKLYQWIRNPSAFMKKDEYTRSLKSKFGITMQGFPDITNDEIDSIVEYIAEPRNYISVYF